jgi:hypothetical protein
MSGWLQDNTFRFYAGMKNSLDYCISYAISSLRGGILF